MVEIKPAVSSIVMEASSSEDKKYMKNMSKNDVHQINATLIQNLYESIIKRKSIDYGKIPESKGDIDKVPHIEDTIESLNILTELYSVNAVSDDSISVVQSAISNIRMLRQQFMTGFKMNNEFVELTYNSLVLSIFDATSLLISNYTTYIMSADEEFKLKGDIDKNRGIVSLNSLRKFNSLCDNGNMAKGLAYMLNEGKDALVGEDILIAGAIIMVLLNIVPLIREIIFFFYHSRVKMADYLNMQADFLEMNKMAIDASNRPASEKKSIIKKQDAIMKKMRKKADKIMINNVDMNDVAKKELKNENSLWSLNSIEKQLSKSKLDGGSFKII